MIEDYPSMARFVAACFVAAAAAPVPAIIILFAIELPLDGVGLAPVILLFGFPVALLHVLLLALPAYQALRRWWRLRWWNSALAGFVIGALPLAAMDGAWVGLAVTGICGGVGGITFWAILRSGTRGRDHPDFDETFA